MLTGNVPVRGDLTLEPEKPPCAFNSVSIADTERRTGIEQNTPTVDQGKPNSMQRG
jgi:hypothetical protein